MYLVKNNKSPYYQVVYFNNGKRSTKSTNETDIRKAKQFLVTFNPDDAIHEKENLATIQHEYELSLTTFLNEYLGYVKPTKSKSYIISIKLSFNKFIEYAGDIQLTNVTNRIIDQFIAFTFKRTQRGASHYFRTLKAAFNKALEWNYISTNPFLSVKFPKIVKSYPAFLTEDELFIIQCNSGYSHLHDIFKVAFYTGMRLGELINMRWNWIDFHKKIITVKCLEDFSTKNKKERIIPMSDAVWLTLNNRFQINSHSAEDFVFYRILNKKLHDETVSKQFKSIVRNSFLNNKIHFHSLRHSFASLLVQRGVSLSVVKELLGHEDLATTQIYAHLQQQNLREAINLF